MAKPYDQRHTGRRRFHIHLAPVICKIIGVQTRSATLNGKTVEAMPLCKETFLELILELCTNSRRKKSRYIVLNSIMYNPSLASQNKIESGEVSTLD